MDIPLLTVSPEDGRNTRFKQFWSRCLQINPEKTKEKILNFSFMLNAKLRYRRMLLDMFFALN